MDYTTDIMIAGDGNSHWAVVSQTGLFRWHYEPSPGGTDEPAPVVLYHGLESREAAEFARQESIGQLDDHGAPYGPSEVPVAYFNALGRILRLLREEGVEHGDLLGLTARIADAAAERAAPSVDQIDLPF